uniref:ZAD domain-containing protein n=1 Tax=Lygus hesperus TaxID=30085 RepID=A0A146KPD1_LYGHE
MDTGCYMELGNTSYVSQDPSGHCRTCGNGHEYYIQIYSDAGKTHELADKINRHLPIMVSESDTLPTQICYQCASTLLAYNDLIEVCLNAEKRFHCLYGYDNDRIPLSSKLDEGEHFRDKNDIVQHKSQESIVNRTSCSNDDKSRVGETQDQVCSHEDHKCEQREFDQFEDSDDAEVDGAEDDGENDFDDGGVIKKRRRKKDSISKCSICGAQ